MYDIEIVLIRMSVFHIKLSQICVSCITSFTEHLIMFYNLHSSDLWLLRQREIKTSLQNDHLRFSSPCQTYHGNTTILKVELFNDKKINLHNNSMKLKHKIPKQQNETVLFKWY